MPAIRPTIVDRVMTELFDPSTSLIPDGEFDIPGTKTVLSLRNRLTTTKEKSTDLLTDIDAAYPRKA